MSIITEQLDAIVVKQLTRATITDGKLLQYFVAKPLCQRDEVLAQYFDALSANRYYNDYLTNNIYHIVNGQKNYDVKIDGNNVLSARNIATSNLQTQAITAASTTATNTSAANYSATNLTTTALSITNDFYVNMTAVGLTNKEKFVDVVDAVKDRAEEVNEIISTNDDNWSSISAIKVIKADDTTATLHPKVLKLKHDSSIQFNNANNLLTIGVTEVHSKATVNNGILVLTNH